jgi:FkbM family methyltransferase
VSLAPTAIAGRLRKSAATRFPSLWVRWRLLHRPASAEAELALLKKIVAPGDVTLDIGANLGLYTRELARLSAKVHAFEPSQAMADILRRSSAGNVTVHELALSDRDGDAELRIPRDGARLTHSLASLEPAAVAEHDVLAVPVRRARLDSVVDEAVSFVKIDVEGHELNVLHGATGLIERCRPAFLVEAEERHGRGGTAALFEFFARRNYQGLFLRGDRIAGVDAFDPRVDQDRTTLLSDGGRRSGRHYINNFFFFPSGKNGRTILAKA